MLTPTDIHILVGLLTKVTSPDDVEIELGELVYDQAANKRRDVDVSVKHKNSEGVITVFRGIEVKNHLRPLTVENIEQLCLKFKDMPELTQKAIVSASGYTTAAIKKAQFHGIELFNLTPWDNTAIGFKQALIPSDEELLSEISYNWKQFPRIAINVPSEFRALLKDVSLQKLSVYLSNGSLVPACSNVEELIQSVASHCAQEHTKTIASKLKSDVEDSFVRRIVEPVEVTYIQYGDIMIPIIDFRIIGVIQYTLIKQKTIYKTLIRQNETEPYVGCAITELKNGDLLGLTVNNVTKEMDIINIRLTERQKKRVSQRKL